MKIKDISHLQIKKSVVKKLISNTLIVGLVASNISISQAGVLSEDGRLETFEGSSITVDDVLKEDDIDVEIEGSTLVNLLNTDYYINDSVDYNSGLYTINQKTSDSNLALNKINIPYKLDTEYTLILDIKENTLSSTSSGNVASITSKGLGVGDYVLNLNDIHIKNGELGVKKIKVTSRDVSGPIFTHMLIHKKNENPSGSIKFSWMLLEGDWVNKEIPEYFEGMKSSFEDQLVTQEMIDSGEEKPENLGKYKVEVKSAGKNLYPYGDIITTWNNISLKSLIGWIKVEPNTTYTVSRKENSEGFIHFIEFKSNNKVFSGHNDCYKKRDGQEIKLVYSNQHSLTFTTGSEINYLYFTASSGRDSVDEFLHSEIMLEKGSVATEYEPYKKSIKIFYLDEPLRGLPNGVKDRIIKRNGQWVIEKNTNEVILDGSSDELWFIDGGRGVEGQSTYFRTTYMKKDGLSHDLNYNNILDFFVNNKYINETAQNNWHLNHQYVQNLDVNRDNTISIRETFTTLTEFKDSLSEKPVTLIYQLVKPLYETLNTDSTINLFKETTHISNNSNIPANMKVVIDRTPNRANEAIELAKANPTSENISKARMWANLLKESILKDEFQDEINDITNVNDIVLERKNVTANLDLYIKSENALSMSLSTNSVTFDNYSGVEGIELKDAVEISINSSLPYDLNAYLETGIQNADKSASMDINLLQIKDSSKDSYQSFSGTSDKIILDEDCSSDSFNVHNIDLKLEGSNAHSVDVYKTTIKFEAMQK